MLFFFYNVSYLKLNIIGISRIQLFQLFQFLLACIQYIFISKKTNTRHYSQWKVAKFNLAKKLIFVT
jgi:hypothetical protein